VRRRDAFGMHVFAFGILGEAGFLCDAVEGSIWVEKEETWANQNLCSSSLLFVPTICDLRCNPHWSQ